MRRSSGIVHAYGSCRDCEAVFDNYKNALALSAKHARQTGHTVEAEQSIAVIYNPKPKS